MRASIPALLLVSCLNENTFAERFSDRACAEATACDPDVECEPFGGDEGGDATECDFDAAKARECLKGTWDCDANTKTVSAPAVCSEVCGGSGTAEEAEDDTDTD